MTAPWWATPEGRAEARAEMLAAGMQRCGHHARLSPIGTRTVLLPVGPYWCPWCNVGRYAQVGRRS